MSSRDGWDDVLRRATSNINLQAGEAKSSTSIAVYIVVWVAAGSHLTFALLLSAILVVFHRMIPKGSALVTTGQLEWVSRVALSIERSAASERAWRSRARQHDEDLNFFKRAVAPFVLSSSLETVSYLVIGASVAGLATSRRTAASFDGIRSRPSMADLIRILSALFFTVEAGLKALSMRPSQYMADPWCRLEVLLVATGLYAVIVAQLLPPSSLVLHGITSLNALRLLRLLKLLQGDQLMRSLLRMVPAVLNVLGLLALLTYVYALVGLDLFRDKRKDPDSGTDGCA
eukprot:2956459-Prymnesium_polylepis.1